MRLILSLILVIVVIQQEQATCSAAEVNDSSTFFDLMVFIDIDHYTINCRELPISILLKKMAKITKTNNAKSWIVIETDSFEKFLSYRDSLPGVDTVIWDRNAEIATKLNFNDLPAVVALNRKGEVLFSCQNQDIYLFLQLTIFRKSRMLNFMELPCIPLDKIPANMKYKTYVQPIIQARELMALDFYHNPLSILYPTNRKISSTTKSQIYLLGN